MAQLEVSLVNESGLSREELSLPEKYLHIFLNNSSKLIEFLEYLIEQSKQISLQTGSSVQLCPEVSNTLLEMYLHEYKNEINEDVSTFYYDSFDKYLVTLNMQGLSENKMKIMAFLQNEDANFDFKKAMILCQMSNFMPGVLYLYEKTRMFKQILAHVVSTQNSEGVMQTCRKYGDEEPKLWVDALWYFSEVYTDQLKDATLEVLQRKFSIS